MSIYEVVTVALAGYSLLLTVIATLARYAYGSDLRRTRESQKEQGERIGAVEGRMLAAEKALVRVDAMREDLLDVKSETKKQTTDLGALKVATAGIQGQLAELTRRMTPPPTSYSKVPR